MNPLLRTACSALLWRQLLLPVPGAKADTQYYVLENVRLSIGGRLLTGLFEFTYTPGDFENGSGQFLSLSIPYTVHDETDLNVTFDIGSSIEITLEGSVHDDGVDITLFFLQPLTASAGAALDLTRSKYEIGGNGFHTGVFISGSVLPVKMELNIQPGLGDTLTLS